MKQIFYVKYIMWAHYTLANPIKKSHINFLTVVLNSSTADKMQPFCFTFQAHIILKRHFEFIL